MGKLINKWQHFQIIISVIKKEWTLDTYDMDESFLKKQYAEWRKPQIVCQVIPCTWSSRTRKNYSMVKKSRKRMAVGGAEWLEAGRGSFLVKLMHYVLTGVSVKWVYALSQFVEPHSEDMCWWCTQVTPQIFLRRSGSEDPKVGGFMGTHTDCCTGSGRSGLHSGKSEPRFPLVQSGKIRERILGDEIIGGQCLRRQLTPGAHSINTDCCPFPPGSPSSSPPCEWGLHLAFKPNSSWSHWTKGITSYPHTELKTTRSSCSNMYASRGCK